MVNYVGIGSEDLQSEAGGQSFEECAAVIRHPECEVRIRARPWKREGSGSRVTGFRPCT